MIMNHRLIGRTLIFGVGNTGSSPVGSSNTKVNYE